MFFRGSTHETRDVPRVRGVRVSEDVKAPRNYQKTSKNSFLEPNLPLFCSRKHLFLGVFLDVIGESIKFLWI